MSTEGGGKGMFSMVSGSVGRGGSGMASGSTGRGGGASVGRSRKSDGYSSSLEKKI